MVTRRGFSLIELLIVVALIGILTAIATASYSTMQKKARDNRRVSDMKAVQQGLEQYFADNGSAYPSPCTGLGTTYLPNGFPVDPKTKLDYSVNCPGTSYCVCAKLEVEVGNAAEDCGTPVISGSHYCVHERQ